MPKPTSNTGSVQIDRLHLRVPGKNKATGDRIAQAFGEALSAHSFEGQPDAQIGDLRVRVKVPRGASERHIVRSMMDGVLQQIRGSGREKGTR